MEKKRSSFEDRKDLLNFKTMYFLNLNLKITQSKNNTFNLKKTSIPENSHKDKKQFRKKYSNIHGHGKGRIIRQTQLPLSTNGVFSARFSPEGRVIAVACGSGSIQLRNGETGELLETIRAGYDQAPPVLCCKFIPSGFHVTEKDNKESSKKKKGKHSKRSSEDEGTSSESEAEELQAQSRLKETAVGMKGRSKGKGYGTFYAGSGCGQIFRCIVEDGLCEKFADEKENEVNTLDIDITSSTLISGGKDTIIRSYDITTKKLLMSYEHTLLDDYKGHNARIFSIRCDLQEPSIFYSGGWDNVVKVWDIRLPEGVVHNLYGPHISGNDAIDIQGDHLLTGSWTVKDAIQIWDIRSMKILEKVSPSNRNYEIDGEFVYSVRFFAGEDSSYDQILVGGSGTGALEVISRKENKVLGFFPIEKSIMTIDSIGSVFIFGGMDNKMKIAEFN